MDLVQSMKSGKGGRVKETWLYIQVLTILVLTKQGISAGVIGKTLGRTELSIRYKQGWTRGFETLGDLCKHFGEAVISSDEAVVKVKDYLAERKAAKDKAEVEAKEAAASIEAEAS